MQAVKSLELRIPSECIGEHEFNALANAMNSSGIAQETDVDSAATSYIAWFDVGQDEVSTRAHISAAALLAGVAAAHISLSTLDSTDWATAWQKDWKAISIGNRLRVRPSFCKSPNDNRIDIVLDPGMAFGTGTHPTTQLCLEAVERICTEMPPATVLDMGAGSGILAISTLKLGAGSALAIDMEEESVEACQTNAAINGVKLNTKLDDIPPNQAFDLVVANILAAPLVWMAKELAACVGDRLVLSGLLITQLDDVAAAYIAEGLTESRRDSQGEWASVELKR
jgi:ribosomal protein L11 methyltransferase